jgi:hypothetical protein
MGKRQAQFRFEEDFYSDLMSLAEQEGITVTEVVRNAIRLYAAIYERTKGGKARLFLESEDTNVAKCEVILPWLP